MNELLLLCNVFLSKDDFINEISIEDYKLESGGNDDQLWLIDYNNDKCVIKIDLILKDVVGNIIQDDIDYGVYEDTDAPYNGYLYSIEFRNDEIMNKVLEQINKQDRNLYVCYNDSNHFIKI